MHVLASFKDYIVWEITAQGAGNIPMLDIALSLRYDNNGRGSVHYMLFEKKLNKYQYIPRDSCHPGHCFEGVARGCAKR
eukprot:6276936-Lingulodinium_polyedra.AAC.1